MTVCADKFVDENTYTFDRWSCARRSIAKVPRSSGKTITTKSCDYFFSDAGFLTTVDVGQYVMTKPRRRNLFYSSTRTVPISERYWTDIEPDNYSSIAYPVSKQLSTRLRHGDLPREEDGAIEFWRLKDYLRNDFVHSQHWSDEMWKSTMARDGVKKEKISILHWSIRTRNSLSPSFSKVIQDATTLTLHCRTMY